MVRDKAVTLSEAATEVRIAVPGLSAGLYELTLRAGGNPDESTSAWVLVVDGTRHGRTHEAYEVARRTAATWGDAPPRAVRSFLRAQLAVMAEEFPR